MIQEVLGFAGNEFRNLCKAAGGEGKYTTKLNDEDRNFFPHLRSIDCHLRLRCRDERSISLRYKRVHLAQAVWLYERRLCYGVLNPL